MRNAGSHLAYEHKSLRGRRRRTGSCLRVGKAIEDLVDHVGVWTLDLDRVRREVVIHIERALEVHGDERRVELPLGEDSGEVR